MRPAFAIPLLGTSLFFLTIPALAQIRPNSADDSLQPATRELLPSENSKTTSPLSPALTTDEPAQTRRRLGKGYWLAWGLAGALSVASAEMTVRCEHLAGCYEGNPLFPQRPNRLELYAPRAGLITFGVLLSRHWKRRNPGTRAPLILALTTDAAWGADAGWDAHQLSNVPKGAR